MVSRSFSLFRYLAAQINTKKTFIGELDGIVHQIQQNLPDSQAISVQFVGDVGGNVHFEEFSPLDLDRGIHDPSAFMDKGADRKEIGSDRQLSGFDLR